MADSAKRLAIFDFDGTMIPGDSIVYLTRYALQKGAMRPSDVPALLLGAVLGRFSSQAEKGKSLALRFMRRMDKEAQQAFFTAFIESELLPRLYPAAVKRLMQHRAKGDLILLVSASTDCYMGLMTARLPVHAVLSTPTKADGTVAHNCKGAEKVRRVQAWLQENSITPDWSNSFAYGDSPSDAAIGSLTGHPVCVNAKKGLLKQQPDWEREDWR